MYNTSFFKKILLIATVVLLYSCDKDFNAIGDNLIGDDHFGLEPEKYDVVAYDQEISPVQSNGLVNNALGIYDDKVFGARTASFATQVSLESYAPTIGAEPVIDSVMVTIPYFSHAISTDASSGKTTYVLDSIYGKPEDKLIKLSVYESGVQMRASYFDNGTQFPQLYYTNQNADFDKFKKETPVAKRLNNGAAGENDNFYFNPLERTDITTDAKTGVKTTTRVAPQMRLRLDKTFFQEKILNAPASVLSASDVFQEYFKGLYFKVEKSGTSAGNLALMDFSKGKITIKYKAKTDITTDAETVKEERSLVINLTGTTASLLDDVKIPAYQTALTDQNKTDGDEFLYLKGGQGSLAVIELNAFGSKLTEIRNNKWLVNEANLVFHIDTDKMAGVYESKRVYLYDLTNNVPVLDYLTDGTGSGAPLGKAVYSGIINIDPTSKRGTTYKIRLTNHIRNIIKSTTAVNVKLGLVVSGDINTVASNKLKLKNTVITDVPRASVLSPLGTILFGGKSTVPDNKRLKLEVYYTKPN